MAAASGGAPNPNAEATAWNLLLETVAGEVVEGLRRAGYRSLLIKGVTVARWLYPDEPRRYSDIDVLVEPGSFEECERVVAGLGFERSPLERAFEGESPSHASTWTRGSVALDLHKSVIGIGVSPIEAWNALSRNGETWQVGSRDACVPDVPARALLLGLHLAQHGPNFALTRDDLRRAMARVPESEWVRAAALARRLGAEAPMAAGLVAVEGGPELCKRLSLETAGGLEVEGSQAFHIAQGLLWFREVRGVRARVGYAAQKLFPPPSLLRSRVEWSRSGPVALLAAYLVRIARLARYAPRAAWVLFRLRSSGSHRPRDR